MKIPKEIYDLVYKFKNLGVWDYLYEDEIFAVNTESGKKMYCSVLGHNRECFALNMYPEKEGWNTYLKLAREPRSKSEEEEQLFSQECFQLIFDDINQLSEDQRKQVKAYTKPRGISIDGENCPYFMRLRKYRMPAPMNDLAELQIVKECLEVAIYIIEGFESGELRTLPRRYNKTERVDVFTKKGDSFSSRLAKIPTEYEEDGVMPRSRTYTLIKDSPKRGILYCDTLFMPHLLKDKSGIPVFPFMFVAVTDEGKVLIMKVLSHYEKDALTLADELADIMIQQRFFPSEIIDRNFRTASFLVNFCKKNGIALNPGKVEFIDNIYDELLKKMRGE